MLPNRAFAMGLEAGSVRSDGEGTAVLVPASAQTNAGDEALVSEAIRLVADLGFVRDIVVLRDEGVTEESREAEFHTTSPILPHPRRGGRGDGAFDRAMTRGAMRRRAIADLIRYESVVQGEHRFGSGCRAVPRSHRESYNLVRRARLMVVKGGGFLHAYGGLDASYYMWYSLWYLRVAHACRIPVVVLPNSFGPFSGIGVKPMIRSAIGRCSLVTARESISARVLGEVVGRAVPVFPDMAFFLPAADRQQGAEICRANGVPLSDTPCVGITVRPYRFPGSPNPEAHYRTYIDSMVGLALHASERGIHPVLVTHVAGPSAHEDDRIAIREVLSRLPDGKASWIDGAEGFARLKAIYANMNLVVGTRFHSVIFSLSEHVPSIAVTYGGNKGDGIMSDLGLARYSVPIARVSPDSLVTSFELLYAESHHVKEHLRAVLPGLGTARDRLITAIQSQLCGEVAA